MIDTILKQNSKGMYKDIREVGCFFVSCLTIAQMKEGKTLTVEQYNSLWDEAHKAGYMYERRVLVSDKIINLAFKSLGSSKKAFEVGTDQADFYDWVKSHPDYKKVDACIEKIEQEEGAAYPYHFRVVNKEGELLFDPYSPQVKKGGSERIIWYRIIDKA
ncbi:hypothetical protein [Treponema denticola]|uniref:Peptidase C39-like domain-containing protein n=1 Tax=Treponema denticola SP33 TaxID=999437 RepID=M2B0H6_TREDN|nr:hypothetical protein [Treponema denticola]EMB22885.1 hypothetical protein HMPREF9733_01708 [Treponema denticola SP33]